MVQKASVLTLVLCIAGASMVWASENKYNNLIDRAATAFEVPAVLIKAVIAKESSFNEKAYRFESKLNDASHGLMQVLYHTAIALGFEGKPDDLYKPDVNIYYGTMLLSINLKCSRGKIDTAISAYNAGWSSKRPFDAKRKKDGNFFNQDYVDKVLEFHKYFLEKK